VSTISTWYTVFTHVTVWTVFTVDTGWTEWTLWTGWRLTSTDTVVAFSVWLSDETEGRDFFSHGDFDFVFGDDLSVDVETGFFNEEFFVPFAGDAVFADSLKVVFDNWDDGVDVELSLDDGVESGDVFGFDVGVWVRVTVGDDDDNLFSALLFVSINVSKNLLQTNIQETTFVESLQGVKLSRECAVVQVFGEIDVQKCGFSVSNNGEPGVNSHFVVVVNVSSDEIDSEFHFVPGVSYAGGGVEENDVVGSAGFIFWWFAIALAFAVGGAECGWGEGERAGDEKRQQY
jgi:hypothetical protein